MNERGRALSVLTMNTLAFTACFAVWMMNGVLVTFLVENRIFLFDKVQIGWLLGIPVLTGSVLRLPVGLLTDRWGGRVVFPALMAIAAAACLGLSYAQGYRDFVLGSLGFGLAGTGFAAGIAYTSVWFSKERQGTALGVFGVGNAGSALTTMAAPLCLRWLTDAGANPEGWRQLPRLYGAMLLATAVVFVLVTTNRRPAHGQGRTLAQQLAPLRSLRVWRFGLYYFLVFGGFVALAQWLVPYYVSAYGIPLALAGMLTSIFSLPSGLIRALGGWMSDRLGARSTMYWVLGVCAVGCLLLVAPRMDITAPGEGVMAIQAGTVTRVDATRVVVGETAYPLRSERGALEQEGTVIWPRSEAWQEPVVQVGQTVKKKELLARGVTHIFFQANVWVFTALVCVVGVAMGIGKAAVYKFIPDYFPNDVGAVGGLVGVIGGLGGFVCPILFGYLLRGTGLWTSCWVFLSALSVICLVWLHLVVRRMLKEQAPRLSEQLEGPQRRSLPSEAGGQLERQRVGS